VLTKNVIVMLHIVLAQSAHFGPILLSFFGWR